MRVAVFNVNDPAQPMPLTVKVALGWSAAIMLVSIAFAVQIFRREAFDVADDMGKTVQYFLGLLALVPAGLAVSSILYMPRQAQIGRNTFLILNYVGMVLACFYLLHLWGVFVGFDAVAEALYKNAVWMWGLVLAYGIFWVGGRLHPDSIGRQRLEQIAIGVGMLCLIVLLLASDLVGALSDVLGKYGGENAERVWLTTVLMFVFGLLTYRILHLKEYFHETPDQQITWQGWLMVSPNVIGFMLFFAGPLLFSFYLSFTDAKVGQVPDLIGIKNYINILNLQIKVQENPGPTDYPQNALDADFVVLDDLKIGNHRYVLGAKDNLFWISMRNTIFYCLLLVPLSTIPAIGLALILDSKLPGMKFYRALYFLPSVAAVVGTALIWRTALYGSTIGFINYGIREVVDGINSIAGTNIEDPRIGWLSDPNLQLFSVVLMGAWQVVGFNTVLFLAGLQGIPTSLYEAASVDGANRWHQFWHVTLPLLAPTTFFVIVTTIINGLQVFNEPYVLYPTQPVPNTVSTGVMHLYRKGFFGFEFGYASAVAWLLFGLILVVTLIQFRISKSYQID